MLLNFHETLIPFGRAVHQKDPMSPKKFINILEYFLRKLNWEEKESKSIVNTWQTYFL